MKRIQQHLFPTPELFWLRFFTLLVMAAVLAVGPASHALAAGGAGGVADAFANVVVTITDIIQQLAIVVGILGLTFWGLGKIARPVFPEISQLTSQYINGFLIGMVIIFLATNVVEALADAIKGSA